MIENHKHKFAAVILAAGKGVRMKSNIPKVMHKLAGKPLLAHVLAAAGQCYPERVVVVVGHGMEDVEQAAKAAFPSCEITIQEKQQGTGHAVQCSQKILDGYNSTVLVLYGDTPLITHETIDRLLEAVAAADIVVLGMHMKDPTGYGRLVVDSMGHLEEIVECRDASPEQKKITLCNSGVMAVRAKYLFELLGKVNSRNAAGEYYLTDIIAVADSRDLRCRVVEANASELAGVNSRAQLAEAEAMMQGRLRAQAMDNGVTLIDPTSVYFSADTQMGSDVVVQPHVVFGNGVIVENGAEIRAFSHIEGARIGKNAIVGPFARLRPGSVLEEGSHVGNFVELKKTRLGKNAKANHLSYVGDAEVGEGANIGAGTITCNYDGVNKFKTNIGPGAFIGSNTSLVAPVTVGAHAIIGAGSVITKDVAADALALERNEQLNKEGKAKEIRQKQQKNA